jgi:hypothetical protein
MNESQSQLHQAFDEEGIRKVMIQQYLFHEVKHHRTAGSEGAERKTATLRALNMADVYKCLQQGTFGYSAAAGVIQIPGRDWFVGHMNSEYFGARPDPHEPLLEFVAPDDSVFRLNIRPFRAILSDEEQKGFDLLTELVLDSSEIEKGSLRQFFTNLKSFVDLNNRGEFKVEGRSYILPARHVDAFFDDVNRFVRSRGEIPMLGHSETYRRLNEPSYVVADMAVLKESPLAFLLENAKE